MEEVYVMCASLTRAQRAKKLLEQKGIVSRLVRAPSGASPEGCGYSLKIRLDAVDTAVGLLRPMKLCSGRVVRLLPEGGFAEVRS